MKVTESSKSCRKYGVFTHIMFRICISSSLLWLTLFSQSVQADVSCQLNGSVAVETPTISPSVSYVGNDLPVGSSIYRLKMQLGTYPGVYCDGAFDLTSYLRVTNEPLGAPTIMTTPNGTGPVYPTNVPGVGVYIWAANQSGGGTSLFSKTSPMPYIAFQHASQGIIRKGPTLDISLIKTGDIPSGASVNASLFPSFEWYIPSTTGYSGLPVQLMTYSFTGSLKFTTQTCTTPDVNVDMGSYDVTNNFNAVGTTTPWRDVSIVMQDCPSFTGYYNGGSGNNQDIVDSGAIDEASRQATTFNVSLTPANPSSNNIISVDNTTDAATGVGVQMGYSTSVDTDPIPPQTLWSANSNWSVVAPTDGRSTFKIPLAARYYQTASTITPGKANVKIIVNIAYK
ncbi:fimbrial protein [Enterobacter sp. CC120223-11]|uniref:fimbrial protein n=1 Tax=Enterobacter sp. CC120223-11 TaxID=1378073 RepID=UPI000BDCB186|nr:fimbrial protein [Enterobacter sp. CC120223-11]SNY58565.1 Pilin (type 1 fimbria component protein) [Enterobacter sp. CC120223-11]